MRNPVRTEAEAFSFVARRSRRSAPRSALAGVARRRLGGARRVPRARARRRRRRSFCAASRRCAEPAIWERAARRGEQAPHPRGRERDLYAGRALLDEIRYRARGYETEVLVVAPALAHTSATGPPTSTARATPRRDGSTRRSPRSRTSVSRRGGRSATRIRSRRSRTRCARSGPTRSSSRPIRPGARTGSSATSSSMPATASRCRSRTWSSISSARPQPRPDR